MTDTYTGPGEFLTITEEKSDATVNRHKRRYQRSQELAGREDGGWLDCACGTGYGSQVIAYQSYTGIDRSWEAIQYAHRNFGSPSARFFCADIRQVCDFGLWFDVILSLETLEHLSIELQQRWIMSVASGLLTPGRGVFIVACPIGNDGPSDYNRYHLHEPSMDGLNALLSRHFTTVEIETEPYVDTAGRDAIQAFAVCR